VRLDDVSALLVHGNTSVSTPALLGLMRRGVPVLWHGFDGRLVGQTLGLAGPGTALREAQHAAARDGARTLGLARAFIAAKIANARRLVLRRAGAGDAAAAPLARYLEARGERVQKSMFVCRLTPTAARRLKRALEGLIDAATDRLMVEPMAGRGFERPEALIF
jgi:CRISPR-associated endonuclease Cas2